MMSPPLPGSDVRVPHCAPPAAVAKTAARCTSQATSPGASFANQNDNTAGCIAETSAGDGSAAASTRSASAIGRTEDCRSRQVPPAATGSERSMSARQMIRARW